MDTKKFSIDVACLPLGHGKPSWLLKNQQMDADETLQAFRDLKAKTLIPTSWGAFKVGFQNPNEPISVLKQLIRGTPDEARVQILNPGEKFSF